MTIDCTDGAGKRTRYEKPLALEMQKQLYTPADCLVFSVPLEGFAPEFYSVSVTEKGHTLFDGLVDEQCAEISENGALLTVYARSRASLLLDNEAVPKSLASPFFLDVFREHARPFGITRYEGENLRHTGEFRIEKGMSAWEVLERFCRINHRLFPRVTEQGVFEISRVFGKKHHRFGRSGADVQPFVWAKRIIKRVKPVSEIVTRENGTELYQVKYAHALAKYKGISRRRVRSYAETTQNQKREYVNQEMRDAFSGSRVLGLLLPGFYSCTPGDSAVFYDSLLTNSADDVIVSVRYSLDQRGQTTELTLWPRTDLRMA